jgi:hypothetical protein
MGNPHAVHYRCLLEVLDWSLPIGSLGLYIPQNIMWTARFEKYSDWLNLGTVLSSHWVKFSRIGKLVPSDRNRRRWSFLEFLFFHNCPASQRTNEHMNTYRKLVASILWFCWPKSSKDLADERQRSVADDESNKQQVHYPVTVLIMASMKEWNNQESENDALFAFGSKSREWEWFDDLRVSLSHRIISYHIISYDIIS